MYIIATVRNFVKISEHFGAKGLQIFFSVIQVAAAIVVYVSCCAISHQHDFATHFLASRYNIRMTNKITTFCEPKLIEYLRNTRYSLYRKIQKG